VRPVSLAINTAIPVPGQPPVHRLASHSKALGDFSYRDAIQDLQHGPVSPLDRIQLPKHCGGVASSEATAVTAGAFRAACARLGIRQSMGRPGSCLDSAVIEAWHSTVEFELRRVEHFATKAAARASVGAWIEDYTTKQRHSGLGMMSPADYEQALAGGEAA